MNPMVAVQDTEGVHGKRMFFLHPSRDGVFGGEFVVHKLFLPSVVYLTGGRDTVYSSHLFLDLWLHTTSGEQAEILLEAPPVFVVGLETLLTGRLVHPIEKIHVDCLVLREKILFVVRI